jgi:hypothetical protein
MLLLPERPTAAVRRRKVLSVQAEAFILLCQVDGNIRGQGMPADARCLGVEVNRERNQIQLVIESDTFDEVEDGQVIPEMTVTFTRFYQ